MINLNKFQICLCLTFFMKSICAAEYVPDLYQDEYITVRGGIVEAGMAPVHFGDQLSLILEVEFDSNEVLVENIDEDLFHQNWGQVSGISLLNSPNVTITNQDGETTIRGAYSFQIIACPDAKTSCPMYKLYELPEFTMGYQVVDNSGAVLSNQSVRFRLFPGSYLAVIPALAIGSEGAEGNYLSYFPVGAGYPRAISIVSSQSEGLWLTLIGGMMFLAGFTPLLIRGKSTSRGSDIASNRSGSRWDAALSVLKDESSNLSDDEWADLMRRCVVWHGMDVLNFNPYMWLSGVNTNMVLVQGVSAEYKALFLDVINQGSIDKQQRGNYVNRFISLAGGVSVHDHRG